MISNKMTPVLKWAGGKTQLLDQLVEKIPKDYNNYYEPFIGGGALFLYLSPRKAFINDINQSLINVYQQLKSFPKEVIDKIKKLDSEPCSKDIYYKLRTKYNDKLSNDIFDSECAALMIWINKHCFNGLYRVNNKGLFNVPYNNKVHCNSIDETNALNISDFLNSSDISITCSDFEDICSKIKVNDFVYFDSPYVPVSDTANFTDYNMNGFSLYDHKRLASLFRDLDRNGTKIMLSNNDVPLVHDLYKGYNIKEINVKRLINRNSNKRTGKEVIITNY